MSYSFNWDCTLPIKNIEDIVSINIVPETTAYDEGDYLSLRGQICIDGEYLASTSEQFLFNECIPLDITLPSNNRTGEIKIDVENFEYKIEDGKKLCLNLRLMIAGYSLDNTPSLVEPEEEEEIQEQPPVIFTKEAIISPKLVEEAKVEHEDHEEDVDYLDFDEVVMPAHQDAVELDDDDSDDEDTTIPKPFLADGARKETLTEKIKQIINKEPVEVKEKTVVVEKPVEVVGKVTEEPIAVTEKVVEKPVTVVEKVVEKPVELIEKVIEKPVELIEKVVKKPIEVIEEPVTVIEEVVEEPVTVVEEEVVPELSGWEEVIQEKPVEVKHHPVMPIPVVKEVVESEETVEELIESLLEPVQEVEEEEEEVFPYPLKSKVEEVVAAQPVEKEKSKIFDMLYGLEQMDSVEEISVEEEPVEEAAEFVAEVPVQVTPQVISKPAPKPVQVAAQPVVQALEVSNEVQQTAPVVISAGWDDSIASQFSDGESIIKIVFVQEEETTITDICTKYNVTEENIYNCANIQAPLCPGDRVMINYGQYRRN